MRNGVKNEGLLDFLGLNLTKSFLISLRVLNQQIGTSVRLFSDSLVDRIYIISKL